MRLRPTERLPTVRMNPSTALGLLLGAVIVVVGALLTTESPLQLFDLPSLLVVLGGTVAATLISYPLREVLRVFRVFLIVLRNENMYAREDMEEIVRVSRQYFNGQVTALDDELEKLKNPFL